MSAHTYFPHYWTVLRIEYPSETVYRLLGSWASSYLQGSSWRLNSGIEKAVKLDKNYIEFHGSSGSVHRCHKGFYGVHVESLGVLEKLVREAGLEPARINHKFLRLARLPITPHPQIF